MAAQINTTNNKSNYYVNTDPYSALTQLDNQENNTLLQVCRQQLCNSNRPLILTSNDTPTMLHNKIANDEAKELTHWQVPHMGKVEESWPENIF